MRCGSFPLMVLLSVTPLVHGNSSVASATQSPGQPAALREFFVQLPERMTGDVAAACEGLDGARRLTCMNQVVDRCTINKRGTFMHCPSDSGVNEIALFPRRGTTPLIGTTIGLSCGRTVFLDYADGTWRDVTASTIPDASAKYLHALTPGGHRLQVSSAKAAQGGDDGCPEEGDYAYDLIWREGRFSRMPDTPASQRVDGQKTSIAEWFVRLPGRYSPLECEETAAAHCFRRPESYATHVVDERNGYVHVCTPSMTHCATLATFRRTQGAPMFGLTIRTDGTFRTVFLQFDKGTWSDVSSRIVPRYRDGDFCVLPRFGTTVEVLDSIGTGPDGGSRGTLRQLQYELVWNGRTFSVLE